MEPDFPAGVAERRARRAAGVLRARGIRLLAAGVVPFSLVVGGCAASSVPGTPSSPAATTTSTAAASPAPSANDWLASGGQDRVTALREAVVGVFGADFRTADRAKCAAVQAVVADDMLWTRTHVVPDSELGAAWQSALINYGNAAAACLDVVDHQDTRSVRDSLRAYLEVLQFSANGAEAVYAFALRAQALLPQ